MLNSANGRGWPEKELFLARDTLCKIYESEMASRGISLDTGNSKTVSPNYHRKPVPIDTHDRGSLIDVHSS
jgi:hypothetical protein